DHKEIAQKLIDAGNGNIVAYNLEKFEGLDHKEIAQKLIDTGGLSSIVCNGEKFEGLDTNIAKKLIDAGSGDFVAYNLEKFEGLDHKEIAQKLIDAGNGNVVAYYLGKSEGLDTEIAQKLIYAGMGDYVTHYLKKFEGIDLIHAYLVHFTEINININIFRKFHKIYVENNPETMEDFLLNMRKLKNNVVLGGDFISLIKEVNEEDIVGEVYPKRDFSPKNIEEYTDATEHLNKYKFNSEGYSFTLSNLLGYKLLDGEEMNQGLLEEFKKYIANISTISKDESSLLEAVNEYSQREGIDIDSTTIESCILEYLLKKGSKGLEININDFDLLIAYKLMGKYDEFMQSSNDKLGSDTDKETQHMVQIQALLKEYGDPLKETIKQLEKSTIEGKDKEFFDSYRKDTPVEVRDLVKEKTIKSLVRSFSGRPQEKIDNTMVERSISKKLEIILQDSGISKNEREEFACEFSSDDLKFGEDEGKQKDFITKWSEKVEQHFGSVDKIGLNIKNIAQTQDSIYQRLQIESNKFESIIDQGGKNKDRRVFARFGKNKYDAYARGVGDICIGVNSEMWKNEDYFELVLFDQERQKNIGTVMLLNMEEDNGDKYLLFGPNPSIEFDDKVSSQKLFEKISKIIKTFAEENNYNGVLFDPTHGRSTNRSGDFQNRLIESQLKDNNNEIKTIDLKKEYQLGGEYIYQNNLSYLSEY
ncbi:MAG: hypothetical protein GY828_01955, partial [Candidatus Gracilibacteria bacterium]|nr:hypothetical protein [Candidatus Gracilibacteria bacterium]